MTRGKGCAMSHRPLSRETFEHKINAMNLYYFILQSFSGNYKNIKSCGKYILLHKLQSLREYRDFDMFLLILYRNTFS